MAYFPGGVQLTELGLRLNAKLLARGEPFVVEAIAIGDGELVNQVDPNQLANELFRATEVRARIINEIVVLFEINFSDFAAQMPVAWHHREIGLFAVDPDIGVILYAYGNAGNDYTTFPPHSSNTWLQRSTQIAVQVANSANVIINIHTSADVAGENIGNQAEIYAGLDAIEKIMQFRTLLQGQGIKITQGIETVTIAADIDGENRETSGGGVGIFDQTETRQADGAKILTFKRITGGTGINVTEDTGTGSISISDNTLPVDLDLYVPLTHPDAPNADVTYATIQEAWGSLQYVSIPVGRKATIHVDAGRYDLTAPLKLQHPNSNRINIVGKEPVRLTMTMFTAITGTAGNYSCTITASNIPAQMQVGDVIAFWGNSSVGMDGAFRVTAVTANNFTISIPTGQPSLAAWNPLNAGTSSACAWFPTRIIQSQRLNDQTIEFFGPGIGTFKNFGIVDVRTSGDRWNTLAFYKGPGAIYLENIAIARADQCCILSSGSGNAIYCSAVFVSNGQKFNIHIYGGVSLEVTPKADSIPFPHVGLASHSSYGTGISITGSSSGYLMDVKSIGNSNTGIAVSGCSQILMQRAVNSAYNTRGLDVSGTSFAQAAGNGGCNFNGNTSADLYASLLGCILYPAGNSRGTASPAANTSGNMNSFIAAG